MDDIDDSSCIFCNRTKDGQPPRNQPPMQRMCYDLLLTRHNDSSVLNATELQYAKLLETNLFNLRAKGSPCLPYVPNTVCDSDGHTFDCIKNRIICIFCNICKKCQINERLNECKCIEMKGRGARRGANNGSDNDADDENDNDNNDNNNNNNDNNEDGMDNNNNDSNGNMNNENDNNENDNDNNDGNNEDGPDDEPNVYNMIESAQSRQELFECMLILARQVPQRDVNMVGAWTTACESLTAGSLADNKQTVRRYALRFDRDIDSFVEVCFLVACVMLFMCIQ